MAIDREKQKEQLEAEKTAVKEELRELGVQNPQTDEDWIATPDTAITSEADPNVAADRSEGWEESRATLALLETRYNNIRRALKKLETGTYGICEISGKEIDEARLEAYPAARTTKEHADEEHTLPNDV